MSENKQLDEIASRLARIESRLVQFMYHMGFDPTSEKLDKPRHTPQVWRKHEEVQR